MAATPKFTQGQEIIVRDMYGEEITAQVDQVLRGHPRITPFAYTVKGKGTFGIGKVREQALSPAN